MHVCDTWRFSAISRVVLWRSESIMSDHIDEWNPQLLSCQPNNFRIFLFLWGGFWFNYWLVFWGGEGTSWWIWRVSRRVGSIKIRYKLKSDSPLILYSANFRYKIANFLRGRWDTRRGQREKEGGVRKKNGRRGWQKFYECKTFGSVNTFLPTEMRWRREREKKENGEREKRKLYENKIYSKSFISNKICLFLYFSFSRMIPFFMENFSRNYFNRPILN